MKKIILITLLSLTAIFSGCRKEIKRSEEDVTVTIAGAFHQDEIVDRWFDWKSQDWRSKTVQYEENILYLEYEGKEYEVKGESYYRHYGNRVGDEIVATLITRTYDDGTIKTELSLD